MTGCGGRRPRSRLRLAPDQGLPLNIDRSGVIAGLAIAIPAIDHPLRILAVELAEPFLSLADVPPALFVSFGLAGGRGIDPCAHGSDWQGYDIDGCPGEAPLKSEGRKGKGKESESSHSAAMSRAACG